MWQHTFEKRFFKHQVIYIKPPRKARMIVTKAHIATFLQRQELLDFLLDTAGDVLVNVYQADHTRTPEGEGKELYGPGDRESRVRVLVVRLQVVHDALLPWSLVSDLTEEAGSLLTLLWPLAQARGLCASR